MKPLNDILAHLAAEQARATQCLLADVGAIRQQLDATHALLVAQLDALASRIVEGYALTPDRKALAHEIETALAHNPVDLARTDEVTNADV